MRRSAIDGNGVDRAFRWTEVFALEALPLLQEGFDSTALDVSADGSLIVGQANDQYGTHAVMWDVEGSLSVIQEVFAAIVPEGWTLERAESATARTQPSPSRARFLRHPVAGTTLRARAPSAGNCGKGRLEKSPCFSCEQA